MTAFVFSAPQVTTEDFERATGWVAKPAGLCRDDRCVPFPIVNGRIDLVAFVGHIGAALAHDSHAGLWAIGPEVGGRSLASAVAPDFELPDLDGRMFRLSSLRGTKVLLHAWASW